MRKEHEKASLLYEGLIKEFPDKPRYFFEYGLVLFGLGRMIKGVEHVEKAIRMDKGFEKFLVELGAIYLSLDKADRAVECLDRYLKYNPASYEAYTRLGHCYLAMGMKQRAQSGYETALSIKPGYPEAVRSLELLRQKAPLESMSCI